MTRHEKLSLTISTCAAALSLVMPIVTYRWLDTSEKQMTNRARIQSAGRVIEDTISDRRGRILSTQLSVEFTNAGKLPAKDLLLIVVFAHGSKPGTVEASATPPDETLKHSAPIAIEWSSEQNVLRGRLEQAIAPGGVVRLVASKPPLAIYAVTEYGDQTPLFLAAGKSYTSSIDYAYSARDRSR